MSKKLFVGLVIGGLLTGFMVGASSSPVVGVVIPALVSTVTAVLAIIFKSPSEETAEAASGEAHKTQKIKTHWRVIPKVLMDSLGVTLIYFFLAYIAGLVTGSGVRTRVWGMFRQREPMALLTVVNDSKSLEEALVRIQAFETLKKQGVSDAVTIATIQKSQPNPGAILATGSPKPPISGATPDPGGIKSEIDQWKGTSDILKGFPAPPPEPSRDILTYTPFDTSPTSPFSPLPPSKG